jgi:hypothetical protein
MCPSPCPPGRGHCASQQEDLRVLVRQKTGPFFSPQGSLPAACCFLPPQTSSLLPEVKNPGEPQLPWKPCQFTCAFPTIFWFGFG